MVISLKPFALIGMLGSFLLLPLSLSAAAECDPVVDECKSSREGHLMLCACLEGPKRDLDFAGLDLRTAVFQKGSSEAEMNLSGADFSGANLSSSEILRGAKLGHARFEGANLEGTNLLGVTEFTTARLKGARFNSRTTLPFDSFNLEEIGTRHQFRRLGCERGMVWIDHDLDTGVSESCE